MLMAEFIAKEYARLLTAEKDAKDLKKAAIIKSEEMARIAELARIGALDAEQKAVQADEALKAISIQHEKATSQQLDFWFSDKNLDKKKGAYELYRDNFKKVPILLILNWPNLKKLCENIKICYVEYICACVTKHSQDLQIILNGAGQPCIERKIPYETMPAVCKCLKCIPVPLGGEQDINDD